MKISNIGQSEKSAKPNPVERISTRILYALIGLTTLVFGMFYLIGYNRPHKENPAFKSPLLTDVLITFIILLIIASMAIVTWAIITSRKRREKNSIGNNGISTGKISTGVAVLTITLLVSSFLLTYSSPMQINGTTYGETFWLKTAGMFVATSSTLFLVASCTIIYSYMHYHRKEKK